MRYSTKHCLMLIMILTQLLMACGTPPLKLEIVGVKEPCEISSNTSVDLSVVGTSKTAKTVKWSAGSGTLSTQNEITTKYTAPEVAEAINVTINASVTADGQTREVPLFCTIKPTTAGSAEATTSATPQPATADSPSAPLGSSETAADDRAATSTFERIIQKGRFTAIIRNDCSVFACSQGNTWEGFEVDMMREFARRWFRSEDAVDFMPVDSGERITSLIQQPDDGDIIAATLTITKKRLEVINFSTTYYQDGQRILVQAASTGINGPCDLRGRKVGVVKNSSGVEGIIARARSCSPAFSIENSLPEFDTDLAAIEALRNGHIAAFTTDGILLEQLAKRFTDLKVVGNDFTVEPYGLGVRKEQDDRFLRLVNTTLQQMSEDGTYAAIHCKHFGNAVHPYPIAAAAGEIPQEFAALLPTNLPQTLASTCAYNALPTNHVVRPGDWLSKLAKQYYGNSSPDYWRIIYDTNKSDIGADPDRIKVGMTLSIPELPPNFRPNLQP